MDYGMIAAAELKGRGRDGGAFLVDLRLPEEYRVEHIPGAVNIPYSRLKDCRSLPRDLLLILYCERGAVSMVAARELAARGYRVKTLIGGIRAWRQLEGR